MKKYLINFLTYGEDLEFEGTLDDAKKAAENGISYTQESIAIKDANTGDVVSTLPWWPVEPNEDDIVTARYGDYGFYGEWVDE